jgi:hypothetical protein
MQFSPWVRSCSKTEVLEQPQIEFFQNPVGADRRFDGRGFEKSGRGAAFPLNSRGRFQKLKFWESPCII